MMEKKKKQVSYWFTMAAKPIKSLELHKTMIQFLIKSDRPWHRELHVCMYAGLEITAGQRTMSGQMFGWPDILSGRLRF